MTDLEPGPVPAPEDQPVPSPPARPEPVNGLGVPDWLVEPLLDAALTGLETMTRTEVPPRLIPLAGRRHPRISRTNREQVLGAIGRHERFTEAVFDRLFEASDEQAATLAGRTAEEVIGLLEGGEAEAPEVVSLLFAADRPEDAGVVAEWASHREESSDTLSGIIEALSRENLEAQERLRRLDLELAHERRARRALERRIEQASASAEAAQATATRLEHQAGWTRIERNAEAARAQDLERQFAELQAAVENGRRERRDLLAELRDLQDRYQRSRQEARELRARLPQVAEAPRVARVSVEAPPTTADLRDRFVQFGARAVLESKRVLLLVDGWNVSLGHIGAERLEDKRRVLEQALESYKTRTGNHVMVIYDGRKVSWFWMPRVGGLSIVRVFTEEETADDYIVGELEAGVEDAHTPVVVTSDKELRKRCIALGAFVVSSEDLAEMLRL